MSTTSHGGDPSRRSRMIAAAPGLAAGLADAEQRARRAVAETAAMLNDRGLLPDAVLPTALMVGVGTSNGWVAPLDGELTLFLALEMLPSPPYDKVLVAHEAIHLIHHRLRPDPWPETVATRLYDEGLATALSQRLVPGLRLDEYLWFDTGWGKWLHDCEAACRASAPNFSNHSTATTIPASSAPTPPSPATSQHAPVTTLAPALSPHSWATSASPARPSSAPTRPGPPASFAAGSQPDPTSVCRRVARTDTVPLLLKSC